MDTILHTPSLTLRISCRFSRLISTLRRNPCANKISVCLITCDRYEYTKRTLESFATHNDLNRFELLHADDASTDPRIFELTKSFGFDTVSRSPVRRGNMATIRAAVSHASNEWVLLLENDWEAVRPFPWDLFELVQRRKDVYQLMLLGAYKERSSQRPFGTTHAALGTPIEWKPLSAGLEVAHTHYGNPPAVTRTAELSWIIAKTNREKDARFRSAAVSLLTARVTENCFYHIGEERTSDFKR